MKLPRNVFEAIGYSYYTYFDEKSPAFIDKLSIIEEADKIIKTLDIIKKKNRLSNYNNIYINPFMGSDKRITIKNSPFPGLNKNTIEDIEIILNDPVYASQSQYMTPLFDCIGWIITTNTGKIKINFIGSYTFEIWKEMIDEDKIFPWDWGMDPKDKDWLSGDDWQDHWNLETFEKPFWKGVEEREFIAKEETDEYIFKESDDFER